jgi:hypothetical protein
MGKVVRSYGIGKGAVKIARLARGHLSISMYHFIGCETGIMQIHILT